jgi:hypothetical protein
MGLNLINVAQKTPTIVLFGRCCLHLYLTKHFLSLQLFIQLNLSVSMSSSSLSCASAPDFLQALRSASDSKPLVETQYLIHTWKSSQSAQSPSNADLASVLVHAAKQNRSDVVRFLLEEGVELHSVLDSCLFAKNMSTEIWDVFVEMGLDVHSYANSVRFKDEPLLE